MQLTVIIVSYNVKFYLEHCLYSVRGACKNIAAEIIVVDNASSDGTIEYLQPKFSEVIFIENKENVGFSRANNQALQMAKGAFVLILNPDTVLSENAIEQCISFFEKQKDTGAAGVKMINGDGNFLPESKRSFPSVIASFFKMSGMASLFPHSGLFNKYALGNLDENKIHQVDVLSGAFLFSTKKILQQLNGFDEGFFMYGEDIDLSYRIQQSGYKNFYLGNNPIVHFKGESTKKNKQYVKNFYNAMDVFLDKHYKGFSGKLLKVSVHIASFLSQIKHQKKMNAVPETGSGHEHYILIGDAASVQAASMIFAAHHFSFEMVSQYKEAIQNPLLLNITQQNTKLVFCIGALTYRDSIEFLQNNKGRCAYLWFHQKAMTVIGCSDIISTSKKIYTSNK